MITIEDRYLKRRLIIWAHKFQPPAAGKTRLIREASRYSRPLLNNHNLKFKEYPGTRNINSYGVDNNLLTWPMILNFQTVAMNLRLL